MKFKGLERPWSPTWAQISSWVLTRENQQTNSKPVHPLQEAQLCQEPPPAECQPQSAGPYLHTIAPGHLEHVTFLFGILPFHPKM